MGRQTPHSRSTSDGADGARGAEQEWVGRGVPIDFVPVATALAAGADATTACEVVGRGLALDGADLGAALQGLRTTTRLVVGHDPGFEEVRSLSTAWSEETLAFLQRLSCEDPLTGLASVAHLRARLAETYRGAGIARLAVEDHHAFVVVDVSGATAPGLGGPASPSDLLGQPGGDDRGVVFTRALELSVVAEVVRSVFCGDETVGRVGAERLLVLSGAEDLQARVRLLRALVAGRVSRPAVTWIERLPADEDAAGELLADLARTA